MHSNNAQVRTKTTRPRRGGLELWYVSVRFICGANVIRPTTTICDAAEQQTVAALYVDRQTVAACNVSLTEIDAPTSRPVSRACLII